MAIIDVVKYNGSPDVFAWKFPSEELSTWSQLIVNESQEAVLYKDGQALDVFKSGRYELDTENIPILNKIINIPFGGRSPFAAEVWFVNKVHSLDIKWGTSTPIQLQDPKYGVFVPVRSFGQFGIRIGDSRKFLTMLAGTLPVFSKDHITRYFRGFFVTKIKDTISSYLINKGISILEINAYLGELSDHMKEATVPLLREYGIETVSFYVNDINVPEEDPAVRKLKDALAKRAEMNIIGYDYHQERSFDTLEGAAKNKGAYPAGTGLGVGLGVGAAVGREIQGMAANISTVRQKSCPKCTAMVAEDSSFCPKCGQDMSRKEEHKPPKCSKCGAELNPSIKFCPECGDRYNPCPKCMADMHEGQRECPVCGYHLPTPCPKCGVAVEMDNAKFCPECGESLVKQCPRCGHAAAGEPKFCPECGENLQRVAEEA